MAADPIVWRSNKSLGEDNIDDLIKRVVSDPAAKVNGGVGNIYSTYFIRDLFARPEVDFLDYYKDIISEFTKDLCLAQNTFGFDYWCQVYDGSHTPHFHFEGKSIVSFVHFIRPVKDCFYFIDNLGNKTYPKQEPGDFIVFPSWATHGIDESYGSIRATIAGNLMFERVISTDNMREYTITAVRNGLTIIEEINGKN